VLHCLLETLATTSLRRQDVSVSCPGTLYCHCSAEHADQQCKAADTTATKYSTRIADINEESFDELSEQPYARPFKTQVRHRARTVQRKVCMFRFCRCSM
jgi:hypothetical protein